MVKSRHRRNEQVIVLLAKNLRKFRKAKDMTIAELAFLIEADYSQVSRMERGKVNFTVSVLVDIAKALEIRPAQFFEEN
jgi:transcriptional regulator with XRE-family HTH domain